MQIVIILTNMAISIHTNTAIPDRQFIDAAGRLVVNGVIQTKAIAKYDYELVIPSYLAISSKVLKVILQILTKV